MAAVSDDSSDSIDEETLRRCQEAVWETKIDKNKDRDNGVQPSKRVIVTDHEHDGNELQVTQGFRKHVAKKLENLLDSVLTVTSSSCVESERRDDDDDDDDDDEGFRLFSTSVPGPTTDNGPAPARRQPVPSSSDSDSEMETRLKEAAVSITDLVPFISSMPSACLENIQKMDDVVDKEKKKKKRPREGSPPNTNLEQENVQLKVKRKKKKKQDANTKEEAAN